MWGDIVPEKFAVLSVLLTYETLPEILEQEITAHECQLDTRIYLPIFSVLWTCLKKVDRNMLFTHPSGS